MRRGAGGVNGADGWLRAVSPVFGGFGRNSASVNASRIRFVERPGMLTLGISGFYLPPAAGAKRGAFTLLEAICLTGETATVRRYYFMVFCTCLCPIGCSNFSSLAASNG